MHFLSNWADKLIQRNLQDEFSEALKWLISQEAMARFSMLSLPTQNNTYLDELPSIPGPALHVRCFSLVRTLI